jgi:hypothetical protein
MIFLEGSARRFWLSRNGLQKKQSLKCEKTRKKVLFSRADGQPDLPQKSTKERKESNLLSMCSLRSFVAKFFAAIIQPEHQVCLVSRLITYFLISNL